MRSVSGLVRAGPAEGAASVEDEGETDLTWPSGEGSCAAMPAVEVDATGGSRSVKAPRGESGGPVSRDSAL
jgi:hypothetical protein